VKRDFADRGERCTWFWLSWNKKSKWFLKL